MTPLETILRRDRAVVLGALGVVVLASWAYVLAGTGMGISAWQMSSLDLALGRAKPMPVGEVSASAMGHAMSAMATQARWSVEYAGIMVSMWWVMMIAMMVPSAAPMILLYAAIARRQREKGSDALLPTGIFAWGYVAVWGFFSVTAAALQWGFEAAGILSPMMNSTSLLFGAAILVAAGLYQLTPPKQACLRHCRGPLQFLMGHWRPGRWGAFRMGAEHGAYCLGCCWALMALLFFGGVMNLYWIAGLAAIVLLEKTIPYGDTFGKVIGGLLVLWGATFLYQAMA